MRTFILTLSILIFSGCSTISPEDCQQKKPKNAGFQAGVKGKKQETGKDYAQTCNLDYISQSEWILGYNNGLKAYCNIDRAYILGVDGKVYHGVCDENFSHHYNIGRKEYLTKRRLEDKKFRERIRSFNLKSYK